MPSILRRNIRVTTMHSWDSRNNNQGFLILKIVKIFNWQVFSLTNKELRLKRFSHATTTLQFSLSNMVKELYAGRVTHKLFEFRTYPILISVNISSYIFLTEITRSNSVQWMIVENFT